MDNCHTAWLSRPISKLATHCKSTKPTQPGCRFRQPDLYKIRTMVRTQPAAPKGNLQVTLEALARQPTGAAPVTLSSLVPVSQCPFSLLPFAVRAPRFALLSINYQPSTINYPRPWSRCLRRPPASQSPCPLNGRKSKFTSHCRPELNRKSGYNCSHFHPSRAVR